MPNSIEDGALVDWPALVVQEQRLLLFWRLQMWSD